MGSFVDCTWDAEGDEVLEAVSESASWSGSSGVAARVLNATGDCDGEIFDSCRPPSTPSLREGVEAFDDTGAGGDD